MSVKRNIILFFIFYSDFYVPLERLHLPMHLSFPLVEKPMTRHKINPVAGTSTATHTLHFLPD
jgi:hypothetical protein